MRFNVEFALLNKALGTYSVPANLLCAVRKPSGNSFNLLSSFIRFARSFSYSFVWCCCLSRGEEKKTTENFCIMFYLIMFHAFVSIILFSSLFVLLLSLSTGTKKMEYKTRQWHEKCFSCCVCKNPIGTKSFIPKEQEIYCAGCYEEKYATRCIKCSKVRYFHTCPRSIFHSSCCIFMFGLAFISTPPWKSHFIFSIFFFFALFHENE